MVYADALSQSEGKITKLEALVHEHEAEIKAAAAINHELKSEIRSLRQEEGVEQPQSSRLAEIEESYQTALGEKDRLANLKDAEIKRMRG
jgi:hypothetical protein